MWWREFSCLMRKQWKFTKNKSKTITKHNNELNSSSAEVSLSFSLQSIIYLLFSFFSSVSQYLCNNLPVYTHTHTHTHAGNMMLISEEGFILDLCELHILFTMWDENKNSLWTERVNSSWTLRGSYWISERRRCSSLTFMNSAAVRSPARSSENLQHGKTLSLFSGVQQL